MDKQPPFSEEEKRFVVAEALKTARVPVETLLSIFKEGNYTPAWDYTFVPHGRTLRSCIDEFDALRSAQQAQYYQPPYHGQPVATSPVKRKSNPDIYDPGMAGPARKRLSIMGSGLEISSTTTRDILPRPAGSNGGSPHGVPSLPPLEPKKRGRPSKETQARRQAELIKRGDLIETSVTQHQVSLHSGGGMRAGYAPIAPSPAQHPPMIWNSAPGTPVDNRGEGGMGGSPAPVASEKKRRAPRAKATKIPGPGEGSFHVNPTSVLPAPEPKQASTSPSAVPADAPVESSQEPAKPPSPAPTPAEEPPKPIEPQPQPES